MTPRPRLTRGQWRALRYFVRHTERCIRERLPIAPLGFAQPEYLDMATRKLEQIGYIVRQGWGYVITPVGTYREKHSWRWW